MSFVSDIGFQKTPARPVEVVLAPQAGLPNALSTLVLIGAMGATGGPSGGGTASGTQTPYTVVTINNVADPVAASTEVVTKFGNGSVLAKMVLAAVNANKNGPNFPPIKCIPLPQGAVDFGTNDVALTVLDKIEAEFVATQFDANSATLRGKLIAEAAAMSGAQRPANSQYGTVAVMANLSVTDPSTLPKPDSQYAMLVTLRDTVGNPYSVGELASACAAVVAAGAVPFNPLDGVAITGVTPPSNMSDWYSVGAGLESETVLAQGWTPLRVLPNGSVAFVRTVTTRVTTGDGVTGAVAYYDVQDFQVLYYFRKAVFARFSQSDFAQAKASQAVAQNAKGEVVRLMQAFEDQGMMQATAQLAKQVIVQRNAQDRSRFDVQIPVNVVPGLHVITSQILAGTQFDSFTV